MRQESDLMRQARSTNRRSVVVIVNVGNYKVGIITITIVIIFVVIIAIAVTVVGNPASEESLGKLVTPITSPKRTEKVLRGANERTNEKMALLVHVS